MDTEALRIALFNLRQAQLWYRSLMTEQARTPRRYDPDEREARDACLFFARMVRRELDAAVDARRKGAPR